MPTHGDFSVLPSVVLVLHVSLALFHLREAFSLKGEGSLSEGPVRKPDFLQEGDTLRHSGDRGDNAWGCPVPQCPARNQ